jgi:ABC-type nickel/cobalt efflux system permease component RcnA
VLGLDDWIAGFSDGTTTVLVVLTAVLLGLRHASDPDHLAAVTTLIASGKENAARQAAGLGAVWGVGHAVTLFAFGVPIVLYEAYLPAALQKWAETLVGFMIVGLAVWLLVRSSRGAFATHAHDGVRHSHAGGKKHPSRARTPWQAFGIGLVHGMGGSAGVGVLLLATVENRALAVGALGILAFFTAVSMVLLSSGWGLTLSRPAVQRSFARVAPVIGVVSLAFGVWYALGAQELVPYAF